jgi:tyrosine-protein kinase Etk/Wzc
MQNSNPIKETSEIIDSKINLSEQIFRYLKNWKWFVLSVFLCLSIAYIYLRYQITQYGLTTTILIKDDKKGGASELDAFSDLGVLGVKKSNLENEIQILKSRTLSQNIIKELRFNVSFFAEGRIITPELYHNSPINIEFEKDSSAFVNSNATFYYSPIDQDFFELADANKENVKKYKFGSFFETKLGKMRVVKTAKHAKNDNTIIIKIAPINVVAASYQGNLKVAQMGDQTSIIQLSVVDPLPQKGY